MLYEKWAGVNTWATWAKA